MFEGVNTPKQNILWNEIIYGKTQNKFSGLFEPPFSLNSTPTKFKLVLPELAE